MKRDPLLYGTQIKVTYKNQSILGCIFGTNVNEVKECCIEMCGKKQDRLSEQTKKIVLRPIDKKYSEITVFLSDVQEDILKLNPTYFFFNS